MTFMVTSGKEVTSVSAFAFQPRTQLSNSSYTVIYLKRHFTLLLNVDVNCCGPLTGSLVVGTSPLGRSSRNLDSEMKLLYRSVLDFVLLNPIALKLLTGLLYLPTTPNTCHCLIVTCTLRQVGLIE